MRLMFCATAMVMAVTTTVPALPAHAAPPGTYLRTCRGVRDIGPGLMAAECRAVSGRFRYTSLDYSGCRSDIGNNNGELMCAGGRPGPGPGGPGPGWGGGPGPGWGGGPGGGLPGGTWLRTCRGPDMRGPVVFAQCQGVGGRWHDTRIDVRNCRSGRLANFNGRLDCDR